NLAPQLAQSLLVPSSGFVTVRSFVQFGGFSWLVAGRLSIVDPLRLSLEKTVGIPDRFHRNCTALATTIDSLHVHFVPQADIRDFCHNRPRLIFVEQPCGRSLARLSIGLRHT